MAETTPDRCSFASVGIWPRESNPSAAGSAMMTSPNTSPSAPRMRNPKRDSLLSTVSTRPSTSTCRAGCEFCSRASAYCTREALEGSLDHQESPSALANCMWLIRGLRRESSCAYEVQVSAEGIIAPEHPTTGAANLGRIRQFARYFETIRPKDAT